MSTEPAGVRQRAERALSETAGGPNMIWPAVGAVLLDRAITLPFFGFEANPVVSSMGPAAWVLVTAGLLAGLVWVWFAAGLHRYVVARWCVTAIAAVHLLAAGSNLLVVAGIL